MLRVLARLSGAIFVAAVLFAAGLAPAEGATAANAGGHDKGAPKVDTRFELLSIVYRLAAAPEFVKAPNAQYARAIDRHFQPYRNHELIRAVRALDARLKKEGYAAGSWDVFGLAAHVGPAPGFAPRVGFGDTSNVDSWESRALFKQDIVALLPKFYADAKGAEFFQQQAAYFRASEAYYQSNGVGIREDWFGKFFGLTKTEEFHPVLSMLGVGQFNYFRFNRAGNLRDTFVIYGANAYDRDGLPLGVDHVAIARSSVHELAHCYANQLVDRLMAALRGPAEKLLAKPAVWSKMKDTFFNNAPYLMYESFVRASAIKYAEKTGTLWASREEAIVVQEKAGFFWMRGLVEHLDAYERDRSAYKTLDDYMPVLIRYFEKVAAA